MAHHLKGLALAAAVVCTFPTVVHAQAAPSGDLRTVPAPWWMRSPVIAATGAVHIYLPANRAQFSATFSEVERTAEAAAAAATRRSAPLDAQLQGFGVTRVQFTRTFTTRPLYRQYRDGEGNRIDNQRADMIENYEVISQVTIEVLDVSVVEQVYNAVAGASPTQISPVGWSLRADDATISALAIAAMRDATRRAREGAEAAGARLGPARVIDPSGSVCRTDVLTGWPGTRAGEESRDVSDDSDIVVAAGRRQAAVPPPPPPPPPAPPPGGFTLRPPMQRLADTACVIFALQ